MSEANNQAATDVSVDRIVICPFCGTRRQRTMLNGQWQRYVLCDCGSEGPKCNYSDGDKEAIRQWNRRFDGQYGIMAKELDAMIVNRLREWMQHFYGSVPWWLDNPEVRPLEQTVTMCLSACLDKDR